MSRLFVFSEVADRVTKTVTDMSNSGKLFYPVIHASYKFSHLASMTPALTPEDYTRRCNSNFPYVLMQYLEKHTPRSRKILSQFPATRVRGY